MAPEVRANQKYGIKADIWSLGIIFYTMICSSIEYNAEGYIARPRDIHQQIFKGKELNFMTVDGNPDEKLKEFLKQMLTIDQNRRISWQNLINHKIFERTDNKILSDVIHNVPLKVLVYQPFGENLEEKKLEDYEKNLPIELKEDLYENTKKTEIRDSVQLDGVIQKESNDKIDVNVAPLNSMSEFNNFIKSDLEKILYKLIKLNNL
jgi:serine/threonine protein kinase